MLRETELLRARFSRLCQGTGDFIMHAIDNQPAIDGIGQYSPWSEPVKSRWAVCSIQMQEYETLEAIPCTHSNSGEMQVFGSAGEIFWVLINLPTQFLVPCLQRERTY